MEPEAQSVALKTLFPSIHLPPSVTLHVISRMIMTFRIGVRARCGGSAVLAGWAGEGSLRSAEQDLHMSEGCACLDLQTLQRFVPRTTHISGLRWAEEGRERATWRHFCSWGHCPFRNHSRLAWPWRAGADLCAGDPASAAHLPQRAVSCVCLGTVPEPCGQSCAGSVWQERTPAVSISLGQRRSRQFRISLLSEF